jgi:hypothetical protein
VQSSDTQFLAPHGNILSGKHGSIRRRFVTIGLDLHSTSDTDKSFSARQIRHVHKGIIERGKQVCNAKDFFALDSLWAQWR